MVKFSVYLNRSVFIMQCKKKCHWTIHEQKRPICLHCVLGLCCLFIHYIILNIPCNEHQCSQTIYSKIGVNKLLYIFAWFDWIWTYFNPYHSRQIQKTTNWWYCFLFFPENRVWHVKSCFLVKIRMKILQYVICWKIHPAYTALNLFGISVSILHCQINSRIL